MPEAFLNIFEFLDYTFFNTFFKNLKQFSHLLVSFASLAELQKWFPLWGERAHS